MRQKFERGFNHLSGDEKRRKRQAKASAWYHLSYEKNKPTDPECHQYYGFPWAVYDILVDLRRSISENGSISQHECNLHTLPTKLDDLVSIDDFKKTLNDCKNSGLKLNHTINELNFKNDLESQGLMTLLNEVLKMGKGIISPTIQSFVMSSLNQITTNLDQSLADYPEPSPLDDELTTISLAVSKDNTFERFVIPSGLDGEISPNFTQRLSASGINVDRIAFKIEPSTGKSDLNQLIICAKGKRQATKKLKNRIEKTTPPPNMRIDFYETIKQDYFDSQTYFDM